MAEKLPAITLTDPNLHEIQPSPAFSPTKDVPPTFPSIDSSAREASARPETPKRTSSSSRPGSSTSKASPGRLIRTFSNNTSPPRGQAQEESNGKQDNRQASPTGIDPLSEHILSRTNTPFSPPTARPSASDAPSKDERSSTDQSSAPAVQAQTRRTDSIDGNHASKDLRKGVKAVSFITKLMGNKKREEDVVPDDESESNAGRPEGNNAEVFVQPLDNIGFNPQQPQPPAYIKMWSKFKKEKIFDRVFLAQELHGGKERKIERKNSSHKFRRRSSPPADSSTVWAMEFSKDGKYLAAAGVDGVVRVWAVLSSSDDRQKHEKQESEESEAKGVDPHAEHVSAPVFQRKPILEYEGHTSTILDLSWSKNNFLLSSSMDKTVRLWHVSRSECLCTFKHNDFVPSIQFHPKDDRFFLAGSLDSKLRLWSIPDKSVAYATQLPDMITAVAFTPDGKYSMAGCLSGVCLFYETEGMKYQSQVHVRSTRGQNAKGSKITGIQASYDHRGDVKLLITSNDSRVRLYNFRDKNLEVKFRGSENNHSQIRAAISDDGKYVVCGSEDRKAYIWSMGPVEADKREKRPVEMFEAHDTITTVVCMAPVQTRALLGKSEDPIYDLCNPPPITLMSRTERGHSRSGSQASSRPPTENGSIQATPADAEGKFERPREPASYLTRSSHKAGNIIVTADFTGSIKVFRQDCAWAKRRVDDDRSSLFSKRNGRLSRTGSVQTRGSQPSIREGRTSTSLSGPSDRIVAWRQGLSSSPSLSKNNSRAESPRASLDQRPDDTAGKSPRQNWTGWGSGEKPSYPAKSTAERQNSEPSVAPNGDRPDSAKSSANQETNPLMLSGGRSYMFWNTGEWKERAQRMQKMHHTHDDDGEEERDAVPDTVFEEGGHLAVRPTLNRGRTDVSELSDERESEPSDYDDAQEEREGAMKCKNCGSRSFEARQTRSGSTKLVCTRCGERA